LRASRSSTADSARTVSSRSARSRSVHSAAPSGAVLWRQPTAIDQHAATLRDGLIRSAVGGPGRGRRSKRLARSSSTATKLSGRPSSRGRPLQLQPRPYLNGRRHIRPPASVIHSGAIRYPIEKEN
jgi:hypothetical protein